MRDDLMGLHPEAEIGRAFLQPLLDCGLFDELPEREVHFHGIQPGRVVAEEFFLGEFLWIEVGLPARVSPSRSAHEKLRHEVEVPSRRSRTGLYLGALFADRTLLRRLLADCFPR